MALSPRQMMPNFVRAPAEFEPPRDVPKNSRTIKEMNDMDPDDSRSPASSRYFEAHDSSNGASSSSSGIPRNVLIINTEPAHPNPIAVPRFLRDFRTATAVKQLVWTVLGCGTDGLLHFNDRGTVIVLQETLQTRLWGLNGHDAAPLVDLIPPLNHWLQERVVILKGKRAVELRIAKSDAALDEFGYPDLRRTLLGLAGRKPRKLQILDAIGNGGILEIPPQGHLISVRKVDTPATPEGDAEIRDIKLMAQLIDPSGVLVESLSECVSSSVVEGGRALARHPRKSVIHSRPAGHLHVVDHDKEQEDEAE